MKTLFNNGWEFVLTALDGPSIPSETESILEWHSVCIPHDWQIYNPEQFNQDGLGWYRKTFMITETDLSGECWIDFDGVYQDCEVYINQQQVQKWKNGYTAFHIRMTEYLRVGENTIHVKVKMETPNSRWYSGAGIYRDVSFSTTNKSYLEHNGIYSSTERITSTNWQLTVDVSTFLESACRIRIVLLDSAGSVCANDSKNISDNEQITSLILEVNQPKLWSPEEPNLYQLHVILEKNHQIIQEEFSNVGFRNFYLDSDKGLFVNDEPYKIHGVCMHHDLGALGSAFSVTALRRQMKILKSMGVNSIRTAHNMFSRDFFDVADEMGFFVVSELTDIWRNQKTEYDYHRFFDKWIDCDAKSWVTRDRNHPCLLMWSIGNEITDTHIRDDGYETTKMLVELVHKYDYRKNGLTTFGSNYMGGKGTQIAAELVDAVGYNYGENLYYEQHKEYPEYCIYGSETASIAQSRGVYHFPLSENILSDDDFQCSALGNSTTSWGAQSFDSLITFDRDCDFSIGQYLWSGFDYIGEPTPYHTKNAYLGQIDTAGFPKDSYYIFQAAWTSWKVNPMIHVFPYWDFNNGQTIDICVCSNLPIMELVFNGESLGKRTFDPNTDKKIIKEWQLPYQNGEIIAKGYDDNGNLMAVDRVASFGNSHQISLTADKSFIHADGEDMVFVEVTVLDESREPVANACDRISISVEGPGVLLGMDNGDSTDYEPYQQSHKKLFSGKVLAIIGSTFDSGLIKIIATAKDLIPAEISLNAIKSEVKEGLSLRNGVIPTTAPTDEQLVRKIDLSRVESECESDKQFIIRARTLPESSQELFWRVTDKHGIDSYIADYEVKDDQIIVTPQANGQIYVRCGVKNGKSHLDRYSMIDFSVEGLEDAFLNPYEEISGGLYSRSNVELTAGNERGVATLRDTESWVTFDDVDFGSFGSDEFTFWLFPLVGDPFDIQIWRGYPSDSNAEMVDTITYSKGTQWNTYIPETFKLSQRFVGRQTITFVFPLKAHIQKFQFKRLNRSYSILSALENDLLYGDDYQVTSKGIEHIGNNVTLQFKEMDFCEGPVDRLIITGRGHNPINSIRLQFTSPNERRIESIEIPNSDDYESLEFSIKALEGKYDIDFVFLPGTDFDFSSFQFEKKA